jgi:hypothetical protein
MTVAPPGERVHAVSAVVLSLGEPFISRALDSLATQSIPLDDVVVIEHVSPFSRAINDGARRVRTPFFVQVDADMILDPACIETLLAHMRPDTGIVVGELRDALMGQVVGVKLFRTACFQEGGMPDSVSPDTEFGASLRDRGWQTEYVSGTAGGPRPTLGEHRPDYSPAYTYRKYLIEGARIRDRGAKHGLFWRMGVLEESRHPLAALAQMAFAHGLFLTFERDELRPVPKAPQCDALESLLAIETRDADPAPELGPLLREGTLREIFRRFASTGRAMGRNQTGGTCLDVFNSLTGVRWNPRALVAKVALSHGVLMDESDVSRLPADERALRDLVVFGVSPEATHWHHVRARALHLLTARRAVRDVPWS